MGVADRRNSPLWDAVAWMSLSLNPQSIIYIEYMRQTGRVSTTPFLLLCAGTLLTATVGGGLRFGLASAAFTRGYILFAVSASFGPVTLTGSPTAAANGPRAERPGSVSDRLRRKC